MSDRLTIDKWSPDDQPREKLRDKGPESLSNAELLAILVGSGYPGVSAVELMKMVLAGCNNSLNDLGRTSIRSLMEYKGVGEAKAITILAACELGRRRQAEEACVAKILNSATAIHNYMSPRMREQDTEEFWLLMMNQSYELLREQRLSQGGITEVTVDVRVLIREAVLANATIVAVCHNHPSGNTTPSKADNDITKTIKAACDIMRIHFLDHVIIGRKQYFSYHEEGRL